MRLRWSSGAKDGTGGVVGIVASRVMQRYHRPAIVLGVEDGVAQGSGRSIAAFHLLDALESMRDLFTKFGGHAHAAGLTLPIGIAGDVAGVGSDRLTRACG